jgi:predicted nucleotide-binding protein
MRTSRSFEGVRFPRAILQKAIESLPWPVNVNPWRDASITRRTSVHGDQWEFDSDEEFFDAYLRNEGLADYWLSYLSPGVIDMGFNLTAYSDGTARVEVYAPTRDDVLRVLNTMSEYAEQNPYVRAKEQSPAEAVLPRPRIFIGHGRSPDWQQLLIFLQSLNKYEVTAYELGARGGLPVADVLQRMLDSANFAVLVMTGDDQMHDGSVRARENVVHEIGLFQGGLGFARAVVVIESGVEPFSNITGINYIRYPSGSIRESFGEVAAALTRELDR